MLWLNLVNRRRLAFTAAFAIVAGITLFSTRPGHAAEEPISVVVDRAKIIKIDQPAATVIVGNPAIADATVFDATTLIITGRSYGTTNLIVMNSEGELVADKVLAVSPPQSTTIQVHRRSSRFSYSCNPNCAPALAPGDHIEYYEKVRIQIEKRNQMSKSSATHQ